MSPKDRTRKVTVTLTPDRIAAVHRAVADGRAESISAYISEALDRHLEDDTLTVLLDELDALYGPPSAEVERWADEAMAPIDEHLARRPTQRRTSTRRQARKSSGA
jgi:antitoxin ParD1/3/4